MKRIIAILALVAFTFSFAPSFASPVNLVSEKIIADQDPKAKKEESKEKKEAKKECIEQKKCCSEKKTEPKK